MITELSDEVVDKIKRVSLDNLKVVLKGIKSELVDSQTEEVGKHVVDIVECQIGIYPFFCRGPNPTDVELSRLKLATIFMYYPEIAEKYL